ncbi:MAG: cyclopropane fatty acyl phospholipid synthase [Balneolaceae bacterium]
MLNSRQYIERLLKQAGIRLNGNRGWDIRVTDQRFYNRVIRSGSVGLGEAYMDGWWECPELDVFFFKIIKTGVNAPLYTPASLLLFLKSVLVNQQKKNRAYEIGRRHYDIGNDLYRVMLDKRMVYTCAYWQNAENLDQAQEAKLDLVCRKLDLQPGQKVLDIGCGWGSFAKYAAEKYDVNVTGITVSKKQMKLGAELCRGLPVEIRLQDYRDLDETFDHIVSLGMIEHVGRKNYRRYMQLVRSCLSGGGGFLLHTIGSGTSVRSTDPWIHKYIFPNSMIPSLSQLGDAFEGQMVMEDWQNFGVDYDKTLMAWFRNFHNGWDQLKKRYSTKFYRMWKFYLLMSAGSFRARSNQLWQIVLSKDGFREGFKPSSYRDYEVAAE